MAEGLHDQNSTSGAEEAHDHEREHEALTASRGKLFLIWHLTCAQVRECCDGAARDIVSSERRLLNWRGDVGFWGDFVTLM